ncbi:MAG: Lrp/AsnC ligand binding domain-containing protein [Proteobacteria bacterium]|nr:Lrp/AsnC ligand binding domain-containing protein [Pseudomonadota bacterium]
MKAIFCQIKCELTKAFDVAAYLVDNFPETAEVYSTSGTYDLLAKFELPDERSYGEFVTKKLQTVPGIRDTYSIVAFKFRWNPEPKPEFEPRAEDMTGRVRKA